MPSYVWFITGCSSGLGRVFVQQILSRGDRVIATARRPETLKDLQEAGAAVLQLDVTEDQATINDVMSKAISIYGRIDVLINNAGFILGGCWEDMSDQQLRGAFDTNVFGPFKVTKALLPHFRERRAGTNVFISSISGWMGYEFNAGYSGTKFALEGMTESLWRETRPLGIRTLVVEPGRFRTELLSSTNLKSENSSIPDYAERSARFNEMLASVNGNQEGDPDKGVSVMLDVIRGEGVAAGREMPLRLPLGLDAYDVVGGKCREMLETLKDWRDVITSTDFDQNKDQ